MGAFIGTIIVILAAVGLITTLLDWFCDFYIWSGKILDKCDTDVPYDPNRSWIGREMAFMFPTFYTWYLKFKK